MALAMTKDEREAFLADVHIGVLSVSSPGRGPLSAPVWYSYEPGGDITILTGTNAPKTLMMREQGRATLVAQTEQAPYSYVTVEGPVILGPLEGDDSLKMAVRLPRSGNGQTVRQRQCRRRQLEGPLDARTLALRGLSQAPNVALARLGECYNSPMIREVAI